MRPSYLQITKITCLATEDDFGSDDLYGILGADAFSLGSYSANEIRTDVAEQVIPPGTTELTIAESDFPDPDDMLAQVDLTHDMDVDRTHGVMTGNARYTIEFRVVSEAQDKCPQTCPICGGPCLRDSSHGGTVHWCGRHEWGAN
jgi:hypothetical protein